jgi:hypothetical protein
MMTFPNPLLEERFLAALASEREGGDR